MDMQTLVLKVAERTSERLLHYIEELTEICSIDSESSYKPGLDRMAQWIANRMGEIGMRASIIENATWGNDVYGVIEGSGGGNVLLLGHLDTVYPVGTAAQRPVRLEGDTIYGPGVSDMKGCLLAALYAVEALLALNFRDFGTIRFLCVSDEEIAQRHSLDLIREACQDSQAAFVLEAARANGDIVSARKGNTVYLLTAKGRSAHAGVEPEKGRNALVELAHQIMQFQSLEGWRPGLTITPGLFNGGTAANVVPEYAQAQIDLRYLTAEDKKETERRWLEMLKKQHVPDVSLTLQALPGVQEPLICTAESLRLVRHAQSIAQLLGFSLDHVLTGGSSDASYTSYYHVPTLDGLGPIGGNDHSPNEYLLKESIAPRTALLAGLIALVGKGHRGGSPQEMKAHTRPSSD